MKKSILALIFLCGCTHEIFPTPQSVLAVHPELVEYISEDLGQCPIRNLQYKAKSNVNHSVLKIHCVSTGSVVVYDCPHEIGYSHERKEWNLNHVNMCTLVKSSSRRDRQINTAIGLGAAYLLTK